jgi:hypothetical protein
MALVVSVAMEQLVKSRQACSIISFPIILFLVIHQPWLCNLVWARLRA